MSLNDRHSFLLWKSVSLIRWASIKNVHTLEEGGGLALSRHNFQFGLCKREEEGI